MNDTHLLKMSESREDVESARPRQLRGEWAICDFTLEEIVQRRAHLGNKGEVQTSMLSANAFTERPKKNGREESIVRQVHLHR